VTRNPARFISLLTVALAAGLAVVAPAQPPPPFRAVDYVSGLQAPVAFVQDATDQTRFFAVEQGGRIRVVRHREIGPDFLDLRNVVLAGGERGLLGMALAPDFPESGRFFVNFTDRNGNTVVARFRRAGPDAAGLASRFDLRWAPDGSATIQQPFSNHNGGHLAFGPDGYLYIGLGDGGSGNDPHHLAQTPSSLLGKFLRIDVNVPDDHPSGYVVPADNPFLGGSPVAARPEIWSFGVRNPWRYSFDDVALGGTGALVMGDVGQASREEINYEPRGRGGRNYGWRNREGTHANVETLPPAYEPLTDPVHEYGHSVGRSITGGYLYRGRSLGPGFRGRYFFADFVTGRVWSLALAIAGTTGEATTASDVRDHTAELGGTAQTGNISSFAADADGELYVISYSRGVVLRIVGVPNAPANLRILR
jgi:glucose/arabinose dehydrogenase